jgi:lipid II:glycine glycyltransferase (peptidoglycan interpeptide bridge formation enzyme)
MERVRLVQAISVTDPVVWNHALLSLPNPHVLQTWSWGQFKARHGWLSTPLLFEEEGCTVAAALVLQRRISRLPVSVLYVPRGPALNWMDTQLAGRVLEALGQLARQRRALFVKIDPDIYYPDDVPGFSPRPACGPEIAQLLEDQGWRFSAEQIQFRNTVLLDLHPSEEELLADMKQKTRYNVRLAARRGVRIRAIDAKDLAGLDQALELFYRLYAETAQRDGFVIRPPDYYYDVWATFLSEGLAFLLLADFEGETVAGIMLFTFGPTAWYMYGASSDRHRKQMPNYLLQWEAIRRAQAAGSTLYDMWGAPDVLDESDPMWGVVRFKLGLGGEIARGLGAWDFPVNRGAYMLYTRIMPRFLDWLRARNRP